MLSMWQEERGKPFYRFQTDEKSIADKMKRREKFFLTGTGLNCPLWIFIAEIARTDTAKKVMKTLCGGKVYFDSKDEVYCSESKISGLPEKVA